MPHAVAGPQYFFSQRYSGGIVEAWVSGIAGDF